MKNKNRDADQLDLDSPLGLADEPSVTTAADHVEGSTDPAQRRRRARALGEDGIEREGSGMGDVNVDPDGAIVIQSRNVLALQVELPRLAQASQIRLRRIEPLDDTLESVFGYLVER